MFFLGGGGGCRQGLIVRGSIVSEVLFTKNQNRRGYWEGVAGGRGGGPRVSQFFLAGGWGGVGEGGQE